MVVSTSSDLIARFLENLSTLNFENNMDGTYLLHTFIYYLFVYYDIHVDIRFIFYNGGSSSVWYNGEIKKHLCLR